MLDSDDVDFAILAWPTGGGWFGLLLGLLVVGAVIYVVATNTEECATMTCVTGHGELVNGQCVCLTPAVPR